MNPIIDLERPLENVLKEEEYIAIKCHKNSVDDDFESYEIDLLYYEEDHLKIGCPET